jgi:hypothetical protein
VGEVSGANQENVREWWYYVVNLPLMSAPWVPVWVFAIVFAMMRHRSRTLFPLVWYIVVVGFFSVAGQKKLPYLLPMMPAQALMLGIAVVPLLRLAYRARMRGIFGAVVLIQTLVAVAWLGAMPLLARSVHTLNVMTVVFTACAAVPVIGSVVRMFRVRPDGWFWAQSLAYVLILTGFGAFYLTPLNNERSPAAVAREVEGLADGTHTAILQSHLPEEVSFYLPLHANVGPAPSAYVAILDDHVDAERRAKAKRPVPVPPPDEELFRSWFPEGRVVSVRRIDLQSAPGDARWKVYEILVRRTAYATASAIACSSCGTAFGCDPPKAEGHGD